MQSAVTQVTSSARQVQKHNRCAMPPHTTPCPNADKHPRADLSYSFLQALTLQRVFIKTKSRDCGIGPAMLGGMYSQHFGLRQDPFSIAPDPSYLFMSERHREALAHLLYGVSGHGTTASGMGGGFVLLTGDIGTGKTTICRCFLEQIPSGCQVAYIFNPKLDVSELLQTICEEFHITLAPTGFGPPTVKHHIDALTAFLLASHARSDSCVLIIDEAQNLHSDVLEQLRLLTNLETHERKLLQIVLIGQPELRTLLERPDMEQLAQRVIARFHLSALNAYETAQYIEHRLAVAGRTGPCPFDGRAQNAVFRLTHGVPRRINLLCGRALLGAWAHGQHQVSRDIVTRAATEVFGPSGTKTRGQFFITPAYVAGFLALLTGAVLAGLGASRTPDLPAEPTAAGASSPASHNEASAAKLASAAPPGGAPEPIDTALPQLTTDINTAWSTLAVIWKIAPDAANPCANLASMQLECYRTNNLSIPQLRQLGRPGILTLRTGNGPPAYAVLIGLTAQNATLRLPGGPHTVGLTTLGRLWTGDFATYWRTPVGYGPGQIGGGTPAFFQQLANQLSALEGSSRPPLSAQALDSALRERVRDFQRAHGLKLDGQPGPMTLMQIENAVGSNAPRLQTQAQ